MALGTGPTELVLNLCPTGMVPTRDMTPHVPLTPAEIAADVLACAELGITTVHLHARDEAGVPTHHKEVYREIIHRIREVRTDLVLGVSCSGRTVTELEDRAQVLDLDGDAKPDLASLTTSSLNFARQASMNSPDVVRGLAERMRERGIMPELEIFDVGMANYACYLADRGILEPPFYANVFVGNVATAQARPLDLAAMLAALPEGTTVGLGGIGAAQRVALLTAVAYDLGVRIGLEDEIFADDARTELATNPGLIALAHRAAALRARPVMLPETFRARFLTER